MSLRDRAEAYALARTEARFDDAYAFTSPAFRDACDPEAWLFGLVGEASFLRGINGLDDDFPLVWRVRLVEEAGDVGTVAMSVSTDTGRGLDVYTRRWIRSESVWLFGDSPGEVCHHRI